MIWSPEHIESRLAGRKARDVPRLLAPKRAAVGALLRWRGAGPEVLLMVRAADPRDRWSGQVALPGGREEPEDRSLRATAIRETHEEVGVDLEAVARPLGRLDAVQAKAKGGLRPLSVTPFVFAATTDELTTQPGPEAAEAFWFPLAQAATGALDDTFVWEVGPVPMKFRCWQFEGRPVWGLTYRMLSGLLELLGP
jgi:8-oxo-dGTP pyrophosphatase MutT (NUDIX family)